MKNRVAYKRKNVYQVSRCGLQYEVGTNLGNAWGYKSSVPHRLPHNTFPYVQEQDYHKDVFCSVDRPHNFYCRHSTRSNCSTHRRLKLMKKFSNEVRWGHSTRSNCSTHRRLKSNKHVTEQILHAFQLLHTPSTKINEKSFLLVPRVPTAPHTVDWNTGQKK